MLRTLDVGCGRYKEEGSTGIDIMASSQTDIVHNLNDFPWPIADNSFDVILCKDIIEHLDNIVRTMEEFHRIARANAKIIIDTPHFANPNSFRDPTHRWHFSVDTFDYFDENFQNPRYTDLKFKLLKKDLVFGRKWGIASILAKLSKRRYEIYYSRRYPPYKLHFELMVIK